MVVSIYEQGKKYFTTSNYSLDYVNITFTIPPKSISDAPVRLRNSDRVSLTFFMLSPY